MHQFENEEQSIRLYCGEIFAIADHDLGNPDFASSTQGLVQERVSFFAAFLRLEKVGLIEKLRIDLLKIDKVRNVDRMGRFDFNLLEVFVVQNNIAAALIFETFHDLIGRHFFHIGLGNLFVFDRAKIAAAQLSKTELLFPRGRVNGDWDIH